MRRPKVYVETSIPSFYFDRRGVPSIVLRRRWTRVWWDIAVERYDLTTGPPVYRELNNGPEARRQEWISLIYPLSPLDVTQEVDEAAEVYMREKLMPGQGEDAVHLAIASVHECDFLVTWDTRHLANARKIPHISKINQRLGLCVPTIATPLQMLERMP